MNAGARVASGGGERYVWRGLESPPPRVSMAAARDAGGEWMMIDRKTLIALVAVIGVSLPLAACGGGGADVKSEVKTTTTGQELTALKNALDTGAITQEESERERRKILAR